MFGDISAIDLARFQFAFTISAHIIFPAFSIGLASFLAVLNGLWLWTRDDIYLRLFDYWKTIFAVVFAMGVVSGVVMSYQFGTNWSVFSDKVGPILGPLLGYEVLSAFFLEAGFLGIMLFGRERVGDRLHLAATAIVAIGTLLSAFWILSANSWMHTPQGYSVNDVGQFAPEDWWAIVFNPSFPYRLVHMVLAAYLTTAFVVGAVGAWHLLRSPESRDAAIMFSMAMWMALIVAPIQIFAGDSHGLNTLEYQPAKIAAMEGHYESYPDGRAPFILFGLPDDATGETRYAVEIPLLGSLILTHDLTTPLLGLDAFPEDARPPAAVIFWTFRIMVAIGFAMLGIGLWSAWARWKGRLYDAPWLHRAAVVMGPSGFLAVLCGWITTEVGRQPYTVYGLLRTDESAAPLQADAVGASLMAFIVVYFLVFGSGTIYVLNLMVSRPKDKIDIDEIGPTRTSGITPVAANLIARRATSKE
ncbi:cytochrome bd-I ubiquinol oxidase subunit 1 apoprotein [Sulfitobacter brevis]|jgi:cytochrome d ubiquinol oxidase subunit I|uniref:Cytochrome bd-I ubiquinol oxidase subunit 1 apoprotein n=2 Tax=Rhodobacterales TaxID=204455 RepID=A0A1I2GQ27_9RHOB|nr:cytochrome ubiquinol oxidase subunit I [Sulfitobacter brevis]SFF19378.1 cytochrome bd-I ubiquinol oxidase subunit 1 apoprotein [Sulfitobacter brevis]